MSTELSKTREAIGVVRDLINQAHKAAYEIGKIPLNEADFSLEAMKDFSFIEVCAGSLVTEIRNGMHSHGKEAGIRYHYKQRLYVTYLDPDVDLNIRELHESHGGQISGPWFSEESAISDCKRRQTYNIIQLAKEATGTRRLQNRRWIVVSYDPTNGTWTKVAMPEPEPHEVDALAARIESTKASAENEKKRAKEKREDTEYAEKVKKLEDKTYALQSRNMTLESELEKAKQTIGNLMLTKPTTKKKTQGKTA